MTSVRSSEVGPSRARSLLRRIGDGLRHFSRQGVWMERLALLAAFGTLVAVVTEYPSGDDDDEAAARQAIEMEEIATREWRAAFAFETVDLQATREAREEAADRVAPVYIVDEERVENRLRSLRERVAALRDERSALEGAIREALLASTSAQSADEITRQTVRDFADGLSERHSLFQDLDVPALLIPWLMPRMDTVPNRLFANTDAEGSQETERLDEPEPGAMEFAHLSELAAVAREGLEHVLTTGILTSGARHDLAETSETPARLHIVRGDRSSGLPRSEQKPLSAIPAASDAAVLLGEWLEDEVGDRREMDEDGGEAGIDGARLAAAAAAVARLDLRDTLVHDPVTTAKHRETARNAVEPVMKSIRRLEIMQEEGRPWTEQSRADVRAYLERKHANMESGPATLAPLAGHMIFAGLVLAAIYYALPLVTQRRDDPRTFLYLALMILCGTLIAGWGIGFLAPSGFMVPVMAGAVLLAILANTRLAAITSLVTVVMLSIQYNYDWRLLVVMGAMALTGVLSVHTVRRRGDMAAAGVKATAAGLGVMLAVILATEPPFMAMAPQTLALIGLNGFACMLIIPGLLPPMERLFGVTTDIQLLEYSDLNNELLSRLAMEAPATYSHSLMLGQLAEAAASAVGANGLLVRVAAYYHDIGKMRRPEYFAENQTGANIHDSLSPRLSAQTIAAHVTDGAAIAEQHRLPRPLVDAIREHHGATLIGCFYQRALAQYDLEDVAEEDYRYPGPKPQSRETAILMICDGVESGVRSIKHLDEQSVREFVTKLVDARAADGQFDECDLTLRDLDTIKKVVSKRILTHYHHRAEYPEPGVPAEQPPNVIPMTGGTES
ncbi:MAG: HD family phosphohydrolase [Candidatus Hydrogenedentota bacterium]